MTYKEQLLHEIFSEHYQCLCFYANKYVKDMDDVKDIVQEIFVKIWENNVDFQNTTALRAYLYTTVYNACMNHIKRANIHDKHHDKIRLETSEIEQQSYMVDRIENEIMWELLSTIEQLPEECRKVFKLSYLEGKDIKEVADILEISTHTVKSQRARAKKLLQEKLKDLFPLLVYFFIR